MRLIQTIILILFTTSGLGATSTDIIDGLKGDYLCYGGGFDYKTEVVKDRYLYEELRKENPTCSIIPEIKNQKDEFKKNHYKILNYQIDPKCSEIASLIGQYKSNSLKTKNYINEVTPQRLDNIFSKTRRLDLDKGELVEVFKGTQIRSSSLAHLAVLCGASDVSVGVNPLWKLKVGLVENPVADTEIITKSGETAKSCHDVHATGSADLKDFFVNVENADRSQNVEFTFDTYSVPDNIKISLDEKNNSKQDV